MPIHEVITGRLTRNPERRQTNKGTQYAAVSVAADSGWGDRQQTFFISAQIFGRRADSVLNYEKGDLVEMIGERHNFNGQDGSVVDTVENAEIYLLKRKNPRNQGNYQNNNGYNQNPQLTPDQVPNTGNNGYQQGNQGGYQNNQGGYNQQPPQNNGQNYQQGQLDTGQTGWEDTGAGQKMNQLNNQNNGYSQNGQNSPQNNSGNQQGNYPNQQGNDAQGQKEQSQDGNQGNGNLPF